MNFRNLESNTVYEVLVSSINDDGTIHIKAFGMSASDDNVVLNLYPNQTLSNIKKRGCFSIHFTSDVLLYTRATLNMIDDNFLEVADISICCEVLGFSDEKVDDKYGENTTTKIIAKPIKIIKNNEIVPTINRATNKIIELLVDYTRLKYMDVYEQEIFMKKIEITENFIKKTGNDKHTEAMHLIKKEVKKE